MLTDTPCAEMTGLKKPARRKIPPVPYNENDSVMKDIQERMKQKRKKKADLNRSRRLNITNASLMLKLSLRANNRALAKALEEAHCEARQDKEMIFELQCALEAAQHELRQCHQMIQDLKLEGQSMIGMLTTLQESEESHRKRVAEVKMLLKEVTAKYLLNTVALIDKAADICNTPSLSKASSIFIRKSSVTEDDSSRDTFSALITEAQGIARSNSHCENGKTAQGEEVSSGILSEPIPEPNDLTETDINESIAIDEAMIPTSDNKIDTQLRRHSSTSRKRSRAAFFLNPKEIQHALASEAGLHSQVCEEKEELSCSGSDFAAHDEDGDKPQEVVADVAENESEKISSLDSVIDEDTVEASDKDHLALEKTDYREQDMELTQRNEKEAQPETSQGDAQAEMEPEIEKIHDKEVLLESKAAKKTKVNGKPKNGKVRKNSTKKQLKKLPVKKSIPKVRDEGNYGTSIFDLSGGESFSKSVSPHRPQMEKKFEQNLSTESEKSEPGEISSSGAGNKSDEPMEAKKGEEDKDMSVREEPVEEASEENEKTKMRRSSRQSHGTLPQGSSLTVEEIPDESIEGTVLASPLGEELSVPHRTLKPLSQILDESSCKEGADMGDSNVLLMKSKLNKKMFKLKQKKRLYDPKKSLDKEFTHTIINSSEDLAPQHAENAALRNSSRFKRRNRSGTAGKEERVKEISNESLSGLLEESWMKDFLNDIDGEDELEATSRSSLRRKKSQVKTRVSRKTFKMDSKVKNGNENRPVIESDGNGLTDDDGEPLVQEETRDKKNRGKEGKAIRRGTVCLKKRSEDLPMVDNSESAARVSMDCDLKEESRTGDVVTKDEMSDLMVGNGRVKNFASFVMMGENSKEPGVTKVRKVMRRGTFDIKPQEEEEDSNADVKVDNRTKENEDKSEKWDKNEGRQKKRKSDIMEKDVEECDGNGLGRTSRKRQKRGGGEEDIEWVEREEKEDPGEGSEMVKRRESKRSSRGRHNDRKRTGDIEKEEVDGIAEKPEVHEDIVEVEDDFLDTRDGYQNEDREKCSLLKQSKLGNVRSKEPVKFDKKQSKMSKVPRFKKMVTISDDSSDENASHNDSISSVESVSVKDDKPKKHHSGIPRRKEGSKSLQTIYGGTTRKEHKTVMNGSCLKIKNLHAEGGLDKEVNTKNHISAIEDRRKNGEVKEEETETENLGKKYEMSVNKKGVGELKNRTTEDKQDDEERGSAEEKTPEEDTVTKDHLAIDNKQKCDKGEAGEVNESGDASKSTSEVCGKIEETVEEETGRRPSRQARAKAAKSLKEPSLSKKLRRGDPFTDNMLLTSPMVKNKKNKKQKRVSQSSKSRSALGDSTNVI